MPVIMYPFTEFANSIIGLVQLFSEFTEAAMAARRQISAD